MIGTCMRCIHSSPTDDYDWVHCGRRDGDVNRTFARHYHDCFEPRTEERE